MSWQDELWICSVRSPLCDRVSTFKAGSVLQCLSDTKLIEISLSTTGDGLPLVFLCALKML